jgi:hypothetical protein
MKVKYFCISLIIAALCFTTLFACGHNENKNTGSAELIKEYKAINSDEEMRHFIAKHSGIPAEDIDLDAIRAAVEERKASEFYNDRINEYKAINSDEELRQFIAKYFGIPAEDIDLDAMRAAAKAD